MTEILQFIKENHDATVWIGIAFLIFCGMTYTFIIELIKTFKNKY